MLFGRKRVKIVQSRNSNKLSGHLGCFYLILTFRNPFRQNMAKAFELPSKNIIFGHLYEVFFVIVV